MWNLIMYITKDYLEERKKEYQELLKERENKLLKEASSLNLLNKEEYEILTRATPKKLKAENFTINNGLKAAINYYSYLIEKTKQPTYKKTGITPVIYVYNCKVIAYLLCLNSIGQYPISFKFVWEDKDINNKIFVNHPVRELAAKTSLDYIECKFDKEKGKINYL